MADDVLERLLQIERQREARRKKRNNWLKALVVFLIAFAIFAACGVQNANEARQRYENQRDLVELLRDN